MGAPSILTSPPEEAAHPRDPARSYAEEAAEEEDDADDDGDETVMLVVKAKERDRDDDVVGGIRKQERREDSRSWEGEGAEEEGEGGGGGIGEGRKDQLGKERRSMEQEKDGESRLLWRWRSKRSRCLAPIEWVQHLGREVDPSFVLGVMVTYGVSQGFGGALYRISGNYFWKDTQLVQPSTAQMYGGIISSVWDWKPVWGLLTDLVPISGYHRRPYFLLSGLLSFFSLIMLLLEVELQNGIAVMLLLLYTLGITIADVTIDAEIAKQSREKAGLATDFQTLCSISSTTGSFLGFLTSGFIVRIMGPKNALGLLSTSGALFLLLSCTLHEAKEHVPSLKATQVCRTMKRTCRSIFQTLCCPQVWKPILYMFISWAASPSIAEGKFYWYTDKELGLGFSEEFVGMSFALGSAGGFLGAVAYQNGLKNYPFRKIMLWAQVLVFVGGIVDLVLILRWNRWLHMPDSMFFLFDEIMIQTVGRLKWIPQLVLCAKLCPAGIEGTFFAILMAVDNVGLMTSMWGGALLQHSLGVKRDDFTNLWLAALIRTLLRLVPLFFLSLVPDALPSSPQLLPSDFTVLNLSDDSDNDNGADDPGSELRPSPFVDDQTVELIAHKS